MSDKPKHIYTSVATRASARRDRRRGRDRALVLLLLVAFLLVLAVLAVMVIDSGSAAVVPSRAGILIAND